MGGAPTLFSRHHPLRLTWWCQGPGWGQGPCSPAFPHVPHTWGSGRNRTRCCRAPFLIAVKGEGRSRQRFGRKTGFQCQQFTGHKALLPGPGKGSRACPCALVPFLSEGVPGASRRGRGSPSPCSFLLSPLGGAGLVQSPGPRRHPQRPMYLPGAAPHSVPAWTAPCPPPSDRWASRGKEQT